MLALIICIEGSRLVQHDFFVNGRMGFQRVRAALILFLIFVAFFVFLMSLFTFAVTSKPNAPIIFPMLYGISVFCFGAIPMIAEGNAILSFSKVENDTIDALCEMNPRDLDDVTNKYTYKMFELAHRFDDIS